MWIRKAGGCRLASVSHPQVYIPGLGDHYVLSTGPRPNLRTIARSMSLRPLVGTSTLGCTRKILGLLTEHCTSMTRIFSISDSLPPCPQYYIQQLEGPCVARVRFTKILPNASRGAIQSLHQFANPNIKARGHGHGSPRLSAAPFAFAERLRTP